MKIIPVILAGGVGSRLWPFSKPDNPKPFIKLPGLQKSLFALTVERLDLLADVDNYVVVANQKYRYLLMNEMKASHLTGECILEPSAKNTLAAILIAAIFVQKKYGEDCQMLVLPSDHVITNKLGFASAVRESQQYVREGKIVTFGIVPDSIETGYGYIRCEGTKVLSFIEKPNYKVAAELLQDGNCLWNSGMFSFKPSVLLQEAAKFCKESLSTLEAVNFVYDGGVYLFDWSRYDNLEKISLDCAIIEKTDKLSVLKTELGWSDVGSWGGFESAFLEKDKCGNASDGAAILLNSNNTLVITQNRPVVALGVKDLVVVSNNEATLVVSRDNLQAVKEFSEYKQISANVYAKVQRPWGNYQVLDYGKEFKVKRIEVAPGGRLSLQLHHFRDEHWTIVEGNARVIVGEEEKDLCKNQAVFIPKGVQHRLCNYSNDLCIVIEVQMGDYLGEDDIVRLQDSYNRN